jgi:hypothetical protein
MKAHTTTLDEIAEKVRAALKNESGAILEIGNLLIQSRQHLDHGDWQSWLAENFSFSYRTAARYVKAGEYALAKSDTAADLRNLSPVLLYRLSEGDFYTEAEEAAILAKTKQGARIGTTVADEICAGLGPPVDDELETESPPVDALEQGDDSEIEKILDGLPPELPAPEPAVVNHMLPAFDLAVKRLLELRTKPLAKFIGSEHSADNVTTAANFLHEVAHTILNEAFAAVGNDVDTDATDGEAKAKVPALDQQFPADGSIPDFLDRRAK